MTNQHPITPSKALEHKWASMFEQHSDMEVFTEVARWGADQELEACVKWFDNQSLVYHRDLEHTFRNARRPKPPSLKEQALETLNWMESEASYDKPMIETIRRALEALPND